MYTSHVFKLKLHQDCKWIVCNKVQGLLEKCLTFLIALYIIIIIMKIHCLNFTKATHLTFLWSTLIMIFFLPFQLADSNFGPVEPTSGTYFVQWHYLVPELSLVLIYPPRTTKHKGKISFNGRSVHNLCVSHTCPLHILYIIVTCFGFLLSRFHVCQQVLLWVSCILCILHQSEVHLNLHWCLVSEQSPQNHLKEITQCAFLK